MKKFIVFSILIATFAISCSNSNSDNWYQYLGPNRNATVAGEAIMQEWTGEGPALLWSVPLGPGYGGASIYDDEVFILDRIEGEKDVLRCLDLKNGDEKWNYTYDADGKLPFPGSRAVPTVDKNYIWCVGPHGHMNCISKKTHQRVWSVNLLETYGGELPNWGFSQSPLLFNDLVIVAPQGETAGIVAFDKLTGEVKWETRRLTGYRFHVSPVLGNYGDIDQVIMISSCVKGDGLSTDEVVAFDAATGKELWKYEGLDSFASIAPATVVDKERLLLTECAYNDKYDPVTVMLEIKMVNGAFNVSELFFNTEAGSKMHPPVLNDGYIYLNNTKGGSMEMTCMDMDGNVVWEKKEAPGFELGALIQINDLIINQNGKNGDIHLIDPSPAGYVEKGKASFFDSEKSQAWAPLAYSKGILLVRDMEKMVGVDLRN